MKKNNYAIMPVRHTLKSLFLQEDIYFRIEIGETYHSENGFSVFDSIPATFKSYPYPVLTKYLEVELLSEVELIDKHSYKANDIRVIRIVPLDELKQNPAVVQYWKECDTPEKKEELKEFMQKESNEILEKRNKRYVLLLFIAFIPLILLIIFYIIVPLILSK